MSIASNTPTVPAISEDPIQVSDIEMPQPPPRHTFKNTPEFPATSPSSKPIKLKELDKLFGPFRFGEFTISRQELHTMGATTYGGTITSANTYFAQPDQAFIDSLEFDPTKVEQRIRSAPTENSHIPATLLFEIATKRSTTAPPLLKEREGNRSVPAEKLGSLLKSAQRLDITRISLPDHLPTWVDQSKSHGMATMGVGLQAYGLYSAIIGTADALKKGHWDEAAINVGGGAAEIGSLIIERGLAKTGEAMIRSGAKTLEHFARTSIGQVLSKGAGLIASVLTLPFDLYTAIKSFSDAANAQGKEAQDHYVNGALSLTSAGVSLILGGAALLGFKAAGPIGIAAAAILIIGAKIYSAARAVDDIDDYIELSVHERWRAGWFAFTGQSQDKALMDRFAIAKTYSDYAKALESKSADWLKNELKESIEAVVNGRFEVTLQPVRHYKYLWDETAGESSYITVDTPIVTEVDDFYDAREGLPTGTPNLVAGETGPAKGILWELGGGNDRIVGVRGKPNFFNYSSGTKALTGGDRDDSFLFQSASDGLKQTPLANQVGTLLGGAGSDTLSLRGNHVPPDLDRDDNRYVGYDIDLKSGTLGLRNASSSVAPTLYANIDSIEAVETLAGASSQVTGSDQADTIVANGHDTINAGAGDDQISIWGNDCHVNGGSGADTYHLKGMTHSVSITEDGRDLSVIHLGVTLEFIQDWRIRDNALVISSLQSADVFLPERQLVINDVYEQISDKRSVRNSLLLFVTNDGYQLKADLPTELNSTIEQSVKVIVVATGAPKVSPVIVNSTVQRVPDSQHAHYFVSRETYRTVFSVDKPRSETPCVLYVDFDSDEIKTVEAIYSVESTTRHGFTYLSYSNTHFKISFKNSHSLLIHGSVEEGPGKKTDMGGAIMASGWQTIHPFTLVMRNGKSYWLDAPQNSHFADAHNPGYRSIESHASLQEKPGKYLFVRPAHERRRLKPTPQRVDIPSATHKAVYSLEGQASFYDLYPTSNTAFELSTPGAQSSSASTWTIHTQQLRENIEIKDVSIKNSLLKIGSVHIQLPNNESSDIPLESVNVIISSGNQYCIDTLFEVSYLNAINAQNHASADAILKDIADHKQRDGLVADLIHIKNIRVKNLSSGNVYYDSETENWTVDSDWSRSIKTEELDIIAKA